MAMVLRTPGRLDDITSSGNFALATRAMARCRGVGSERLSKVAGVPVPSDSIKAKNTSSFSPASRITEIPSDALPCSPARAWQNRKAFCQ